MLLHQSEASFLLNFLERNVSWPNVCEKVFMQIYVFFQGFL